MASTVHCPCLCWLPCGMPTVIPLLSFVVFVVVCVCCPSTTPRPCRPVHCPNSCPPLSGRRCSRCLAQSCMQEWLINVCKASIHALPRRPNHCPPPLGSRRCPCRGRPLNVFFVPPPSPRWPNLSPPSQQQSSSSLLWSCNDGRGGGCTAIVVAAQQWQRSDGSAAMAAQ